MMKKEDWKFWKTEFKLILPWVKVSDKSCQFADVVKQFYQISQKVWSRRPEKTHFLGPWRKETWDKTMFMWSHYSAKFIKKCCNNAQYVITNVEFESTGYSVRLWPWKFLPLWKPRFLEPPWFIFMPNMWTLHKIHFAFLSHVSIFINVIFVLLLFRYVSWKSSINFVLSNSTKDSNSQLIM